MLYGKQSTPSHLTDRDYKLQTKKSVDKRWMVTRINLLGGHTACLLVILININSKSMPIEKQKQCNIAQYPLKWE